MGLFSELFKSPFEKWLENATEKELEEKYEELRRQWIKDGCGCNGEITPEMKAIQIEWNKRSENKLKNNPNRNIDPNFRWTDKNRWE